MHRSVKRLFLLPILGMMALLLPSCTSAGPVPRGYEAKTYTVTEAFHSVSVSTKTAAITLAPAADGVCRVECAERKRLTYAVTVTDGVLSVELCDTRAWYERLFNFATPSLTLYLPQPSYDALTVRGSTGSLKVLADLTFGSVDATLSTGDVIFCATVTGNVRIHGSTGKTVLENLTVASLDLKRSTGDITLTGVSASGDVAVCVSTGDVTVTDLVAGSFRSEGSTGDVTLTDVRVGTRLEIKRDTGDTTVTDCEATDVALENSTGKVCLTGVRAVTLDSRADTGNLLLRDTIAEEKLTVVRSTGDVEFVDADAGEIDVLTDTGKVTGTLLTEKVFIVRSDTGRIDVPETVSGGKCKIVTDTGRIQIAIS